jgi:hypothetical protein
MGMEQFLFGPKIEEMEKVRKSLDRYVNAFAGRVDEDKKKVYDECVMVDTNEGIKCINCLHAIIQHYPFSLRQLEEQLVRHYYQYHSNMMGETESGEYGENEALDRPSNNSSSDVSGGAGN